MEPDRTWSLDAIIAETRADVRHLQTDTSELRQDVRRLDARLFQLLLLELATLATVLAGLVTALVNALE
jgi:hypothetical protein